MSILFGRAETERDLRPFWSKDISPAIDALLDMRRLELVSESDAREVWLFLRTDQERFTREVRRLEDEAAKGVALTRDALVGL